MNKNPYAPGSYLHRLVADAAPRPRRRKRRSPQDPPGVRQLRRLIAVDAAQGGDGLHRANLARHFGVSHRTISRDHDLLRAVSGDAGLCARNPETGEYWWVYENAANRVFNERLTAKPKRKRK
jgi:hypothetical protein